MMIRFRPAAGIAEDGPRATDHSRSIAMKWETPAAIDFRFGMEITMYIANR